MILDPPEQQVVTPITWRCYRITNVPSSWEKRTLLDALKTVHESLNNLFEDELELYPACSGNTKVGLLYREESPEYFQPLETKNSIPIALTDPSNPRQLIHLIVDCHFHHLTPLNNPKGERITAELVTSSDF